MTGQRGVAQDTEESIDRQDGDVTTRIVSHIAALEGVEPETLAPRLYDTIDPEALATVVESASVEAAVTLEFRYADYLVTIHAGERVDINATPI